MKKKEAIEIIETYKPHKGFFDLSNKPDSLDIITYAKILNIQNYLVYEAKIMQDKNVRENNSRVWTESKEISRRLQGIIFEYWDLDKLV